MSRKLTASGVTISVGAAAGADSLVLPLGLAAKLAEGIAAKKIVDIAGIAWAKPVSRLLVRSLPTMFVPPDNDRLHRMGSFLSGLLCQATGQEFKTGTV